MKRFATPSALLAIAGIASIGACDEAGTVIPQDASADASTDVGVDVSADAPADAAASLGPFGNSPPIDGNVQMANLTGPVDVIRDKNGLVHIWATNVNDALRVEGYQMARDRGAQMEIFRRYAEGRLAEVYGAFLPALVDLDVSMRTVGCGREGQAMYAALGDGMPAHTEAKGWLDAFADGVSQFNARVNSGAETIPASVLGLDKSMFTPWTGADTLAIARFEAWDLSWQADGDIARTAYVQAARAAFPSGPRAGILVDTVRFAPLDPTLAMNGFPNDPGHTMALVEPARATAPRPRITAPPAAPVVSADLLRDVQPFLDATTLARGVLGRGDLRGSNNWVVGPQLTKSGHPEVASDPHLALQSPAIWWHVQLDVHDPSSSDTSQDIHAEGVTIPGVPGFILGFNQHIGWGATVTDYDVNDVFSETLTPDGSAVVFNGQNVPLQKVHETINIEGGKTMQYDRLEVPQHGTIVPTLVNHQVVPPDPTKGALSVAWVGQKPTFEVSALPGFLRAKNVEDFRAAIRNWATPSQNWVVGDDSGNIFYTTQSQIPLRDKRAYTWDPATFTGTLPCFIEKGDGTAEWSGQFLDEAFVPHVKNPPQHYIGTANGDQVGDTLDNDPSNDLLPNGNPVYLACFHDTGFRVGRIHHLIENVGHPITLDDMAAIQADARSAIGSELAPGLVTALEHAQAEAATPGTHPDLTAVVSSARYQAANIKALHDMFVQWGSAVDYDTPSGLSPDDDSPITDATQLSASQATLVFQVWLMRVAQAILGDELNAMMQNPPPLEMRVVTTYLLTADKTKLATYDATAGDSALFDDLTTANVTETRDERQVTSLLDAIDYLNAKLGTDRTKWQWARLHTIVFQPLVSTWTKLTIPPTNDPHFAGGFPRHGDGYDIDRADPDSMPVNLTDATFGYTAGPSQRFVTDLDPAGPTTRNVLPGGEIWDDTSKHFADEVEMWRRNQNHPIWFTHDDVAANAESRTSYHP